LSVLTDRIRGIVKPRANLPGPSGVPDRVTRDLSVLGGTWQDGCFVVERRWEPSARHGRGTVGSYAECLANASSDAALFAGGVHAPELTPSNRPFVFFDLETTGLSGGAGTHAFLVGCGSFGPSGAFVTRQFLMTAYADEPAMLATVAAELSGAGALVSFNGKSFDAPVLETRYLLHRLAWPGDGMAHVDVLHPARRFWGDGECSLVALERQLLGVRRVGDVPGFEIPARYFQFIRNGDAAPLAAVLEHNRLDLLSLAAFAARLLHVAHAGPDATRDAREALAIGRVYGRAGYDERARDALRAAVEKCRSPRGAFDPVRIEALRLLALVLRRTHRFDEAAACWQELLDMRGCPTIVAREAGEALAIHHEHRLRDFESAKLFALRTLECAQRGKRPGWTQAVHHRVARIDRKLASLKSEVRSLTLLPSDF